MHNKKSALQVVEQLLDLQYQRTKATDEDFQGKLKALNEEFSAERSEIAAAHAKHRKDMNDIILAMQSQFTELEADLRQVCCRGSIRCRLQFRQLEFCAVPLCRSSVPFLCAVPHCIRVAVWSLSCLFTQEM
jgi:two-component sensor histidine kinase